ncbi:MAG TPA: Holliday junction resolvase RuvX [Burkholderiaceae bacterium]
MTFIAFDYGTKRIGVATGNRITGTAQGLKSIAPDFAQIEKLIKEWQPEALVIGVPFHPDGAEHEITQRARRFGRQLKGRFRLAVFEVDERYTSVEAESLGAKDVDSMAAALILEQFFREHSS